MPQENRTYIKSLIKKASRLNRHCGYQVNACTHEAEPEPIDQDCSYFCNAPTLLAEWWCPSGSGPNQSDANASQSFGSVRLCLPLVCKQDWSARPSQGHSP